MGQTVAHDDPVNGPTINRRPAFARIPHHFGIDAGPLDRQTVGINPRKHVQIDEAVIDRCNQCVGTGMGKTRQIIVTARAIHDHEIAAQNHFAQRGRKAFAFVQLGFVGIRKFAAIDRAMIGHRKLQTLFLIECRAVFDITRQGPLTGIDIKRSDLEPHLHQGNNQMHRRGRLA